MYREYRQRIKNIATMVEASALHGVGDPGSFDLLG